MSINNISTKNFHYLEPDYSLPTFEIDKNLEGKIRDKLKFLYGEESLDKLYAELYRLLKVYYAHKTSEMIEWENDFDEINRFTEKDVILITYGDLIVGKSQKPLVTLEKLCKTYLKGVFNTLHILPFYPYSSDRGFSVMDFEEVDPHLGTWDDILNLKDDFKLMFDGVFNHVSSKSRWFQEFLNQNPNYQNFFTVFSTKEEISPDHLKLIVRPRTSDVLTEFRTLHGNRLVWTTFSPDQIDLNFKNPEVLLKMVDILLTYVRRGADMIRLDAVTYLWEELGTTCVHLDQSHVSIKLFRDVLDAVAPHVALITETNVPHKENIRYFGNGHDEAQMVYNFALPPLVLHTFQTENSRKLTEWAASLEKISDSATYFNFLDSHDGIGIMAVKNILEPEEIEMMALKVVEHGGFISYKSEGDGQEVPYELNITWYSAINRDDSFDSRELNIRRYIASRAIALVIIGVPGIYLHGLLGSKNDAEAVLEEGHIRSINRTSILKRELLAELEDRSSTIYHVATGITRLIHYRIEEKCFHPDAPQSVLNLSENVFSVLRTSVDGQENILVIINITDGRENLSIDLKKHTISSRLWMCILNKKLYNADNDRLELNLEPYEILWLKENSF